MLYPPIELDSKRKVLWSLHNFPENVFLFEDYQGLEGKDSLMNNLENQAFEQDLPTPKQDLVANNMSLIYHTNTLVCNKVIPKSK